MGARAIAIGEGVGDGEAEGEVGGEVIPGGDGRKPLTASRRLFARVTALVVTGQGAS